MAGKVVVSTLNDDTGVLATQNGMTGIAKAWILYNGVTQTITNSYNVSSVTYNGTGDYTINFTTAMPNANYGAVFGGGTVNAQAVNITERHGSNIRTTTQLRIYELNESWGTANANFVSVAIFSS